MTTSRPRLRALCAAVALVLLVASCGGDDDSSDETTTTTEAEEETTTTEDESTTTEDGGGGISDPDDDDTTTTEGDDTDTDAAAVAEAIVLTAEDFTDEWVSEPDEPTDEDIRECFTDFDDELVADFTSDNFTREGTTTDSVSQLGSTGLVMTDADVAAGFVDEFATEGFALCVEDQFEASLGADLLAVALDPAPDAAPLGDQAAALNGTITIAADDGTPVDGEVSLWLIRTEQALTGLSIVTFGETDPGADVATLTDESTSVVADRQAAAVG